MPNRLICRWLTWAIEVGGVRPCILTLVLWGVYETLQINKCLVAWLTRDEKLPNSQWCSICRNVPMNRHTGEIFRHIDMPSCLLCHIYVSTDLLLLRHDGKNVAKVIEIPSHEEDENAEKTFFKMKTFSLLLERVKIFYAQELVTLREFSPFPGITLFGRMVYLHSIRHSRQPLGLNWIERATVGFLVMTRRQPYWKI